MRSLFINILKQFEVDRSVFWAVLSRVWALAAAPVTVVLISKIFSPEVQGYHYTFSSLTAMQVVIELGLGTVIIQFASHEWSRLRMTPGGEVVGDETSLSRLISLSNIIFKWYAIAGVLLTLLLGIAGTFFLERGLGINWFWPWLSLSLLTGINMITVPVWSLLEGCNQVAKVYWFRFIQAVFHNFSIWIALLCGAGLWAIAISALISLVVTGTLFLRYYKGFLRTIVFARPKTARLSWRQEIFPLQWRIAISWLIGHFVFGLFTPILFHYHGPVPAGKMGMTWSLVTIVTTIALAWISPRAPLFGMFVSEKQYDALDALFWRITRITGFVALLVAAAIVGLVYFINAIDFFIADRILSPHTIMIFATACVFWSLSFPFSAYLRAHKKEPLIIINVVAGLAIGLGSLFGGKLYGAQGMAMVFLMVNLVVMVPIVLTWRHCKRTWHRS